MIPELPTLDVAFGADVSIPDALTRDGEPSAANPIVESLIEQAFAAIRRFIDPYRELKYSLHRGTAPWRENKALPVPRMTKRQFATYLFYVIETDRVHVRIKGNSTSSFQQ